LYKVQAWGASNKAIVSCFKRLLSLPYIPATQTKHTGNNDGKPPSPGDGSVSSRVTMPADTHSFSDTERGSQIAAYRRDRHVSC